MFQLILDILRENTFVLQYLIKMVNVIIKKKEIPMQVILNIRDQKKIKSL